MAAEGHSGGHGPMHQFEIQPLISWQPAGIDLSFTNSSLFMTLAVALLGFFFCLGGSKKAMVPGKWQSTAEVCYEFIADMLRETVGPEGRKYFPFIFSLFMFILACNILGLFPYSFTVTSHIFVTFALAMLVFVGVTVIGMVRHGGGFFKYFLPEGTPKILIPVMILIELFSYLIRPVTLSVRLGANMMAGHVLLKVLAGFVLSMGLFGVLPIAFMVLMTAFELFIAILQAYVFTILTCVYLHDAVHLH